MKLLLLILSVMTFTVQTKISVSQDGECPYNMGVEYSNTYQKGDVRKGDIAQLRLTQLGGITLEKIEVYVRSNADAGAGVFTVQTHEGTVTLASKSGSFKDWFNKWDNSEYHALTLVNQSVQNVYDLTIHLQGTENSLHIEKYVITYADAPARTVALMTGGTKFAELTEESGGQGVLLPSVSDLPTWRFVGWSETEFITMHELPQLYPANKKYYPEANCTLWAVYEYRDTATHYVQELVSGEYLYVNIGLNIALTGVPANGKMANATINMSDEMQVYTIDFTDAETAYITHTATDTPIGYKSIGLAAEASPWKVYHVGEETIFYADINGKRYVLWLNLSDDNYYTYYVGLFQTESLGGSALRLLPANMEAPRYTCHPEAQGIEEVTDDVLTVTGEWIIPFGNYELVIRDGQKYLRLKE